MRFYFCKKFLIFIKNLKNFFINFKARIYRLLERFWCVKALFYNP